MPMLLKRESRSNRYQILPLLPVADNGATHQWLLGVK
jgi:hypothetical protein